MMKHFEDQSLFVHVQGFGSSSVEGRFLRVSDQCDTREGNSEVCRG